MEMIRFEGADSTLLVPALGGWSEMCKQAREVMMICEMLAFLDGLIECGRRARWHTCRRKGTLSVIDLSAICMT